MSQFSLLRPVLVMPPTVRGTAWRSLWSTLQQDLQGIVREFPQGVALASSLAAEDMLLTHAVFTLDLPIDVFTLETGRLDADTVAMRDVVTARYGKSLIVVRPDADAVAAYVGEHGANAFYESVPLRKACCEIRKVAPLRQVLANRPAWITGQRREQAVTRGSLPAREFDGVFGLEKFNPLSAWSVEELWEAIRELDVPYNPLHDRGYPSIGCEPCTRAVRLGEDLRAGRWWWESSDSKECGLHAGNLATVPTQGST